jgi:negative regulator of sigma E activity
MDEHHLQALSRFFDGELVDPQLLVESLADPEAPQHLSQWARLRALVRDDDCRPSAKFHAAMAPVLNAASERRTLWTRWIGPGLAACLVMVAALIGYHIGADAQLASDDRVAAAAASRTPTPQATIGPTATPAALVPSNTAEVNHSSRQSAGSVQDWPVANGRLRFESWRETQPGGHD